MPDDIDEDFDLDEFIQNGFVWTNEEDLLSELIEQAKECIRLETDAKADALLNKFIELQTTTWQ
ncbi:MAG: hypothetical protein IPF72_10385 [Chitinophagaceae bacterium]|nr:hypothetical protein [Chitinophagaceae bacterium]